VFAANGGGYVENTLLFSKRGLNRMFKRILLSLDGSESAEIVIPYAEELARTFGSVIDVVGVGEGSNEAQDHMFQGYLKDIAVKLRALQIEVNFVHLTGKPASEILNFAAKNNSELIVMAARGKSSAGKWTMGSVSEKVLRITTRPLLLVSRGSPALKENELPVYKKVLAPLDSSELGESALPYAIEICRKTGATLQVLNIIPHAFHEVGGPAHKIQHELVGLLKLQAKEYLEGIRSRLEGEGIEFKSEIVSGYPAITILEYAKANSVDLIAISSHGQSGIDRFVMGSTTDKVIHNSENPVLLVRVKPGKNSK
jgi:nucleotide-binding universal stress UspA family protein